MKLFFLCVAIFLVCFKVSWSLQTSDGGVCTVKISSLLTKRISYSIVVNRYGRRQVVRRYRNQAFKTWKNHTVCCQGWQHDSNLDACTPVCSTGCLNGTCVAPSTCFCEAPLYLDQERLNSCLNPVCDPPCVNSICNKNNICECENNTRRYNKTHCAHCSDHFTINPDLSCSPTCDPPCVNGQCTAPNTCSCFDGYHDDGVNCTPVCAMCVNSSCVAPNVCSCFKGYTAVDQTTCSPKCDSCSNGVCVAPGICECSNGYSEVDGSCEPVCDEECVNGYCNAPGRCACAEGFVTRNTSLCGRPCLPECNGTCNLDGTCKPGVCLTWVESRVRSIKYWDATATSPATYPDNSYVANIELEFAYWRRRPAVA